MTKCTKCDKGCPAEISLYEQVWHHLMPSAQLARRADCVHCGCLNAEPEGLL